MKGIKYIASFKDYSGYASAARKNAAALYAENIPVCGTNVSFAPNESLIGRNDLDVVNTILSSHTPYDVVLQHLTPENYPHFIEENMFNVGHTVWEANVIHPLWVAPLNRMNLVLVPCEWNVQVMKDSGVKTEAVVYPHAFDTTMFDNVEPHPVTQRGKKLKFYSIFQWSERKNPIGLLRAFCSEFTAGDDVVLFLKTYAGSGSQLDMQWLKEQIEKALISTGRHSQQLPEIVLLTNLTTEDKIRQLHKGCDIYLAPSRGEGFCVPAFEAALAGNHVITTGYGGQTDFLSAGIYDIIPYQLTPVTGMSHIKWYTADMLWAEPNLDYLCRRMRENYEYWKQEGRLPNSEHRLDHAANLRQEYSYRTVTRNLVKALEERL